MWTSHRRSSRFGGARSSVHLTGFLLFFANAGCGSDVRVEDEGGATGTGATGASPDGTGSGGSSTGGGGDGGGGVAPVPGCEQLVLRPDALTIPDGTVGQILSIDDDNLAIVYRAAGSNPDMFWETRSRRIVGAFDAWPPLVSEPLIHGNHQVDLSVPAHARSDGAFVARGFDGWFVGSVYDESVLVGPPSHDPNDYPILEPEPGGGVFWSNDGILEHYATLDAAEPSESFVFATPLSVRSHGVGFDGTRLIVEDAQLYTWSGTWSVLGGPPKPTEVVDQILNRPDGFYLRDYLTLYPYASDGWLPSVTLEGPPEQNPVGLDPPTHAASAWRRGVAVAVLPPQPNDVWVSVTDAARTTSTHADLGACFNGISLVASPDGAHLYVGILHCAEPAFVVRRFDCLSGS